MTTPPPLPTQAPAKENAVFPLVVSVFMMVVNLLILAYGAYLVLYEVPLYMNIFKDMGAKLPAITQMVLSAGWLLLLLVPVLALWTVLAQFLVKRRSVACILHLVVLLLSTAFVGVILLSLRMPMMALLESVRGQ